jgi:hypothetical protein
MAGGGVPSASLVRRCFTCLHRDLLLFCRSSGARATGITTILRNPTIQRLHSHDGIRVVLFIVLPGSGATPRYGDAYNMLPHSFFASTCTWTFCSYYSAVLSPFFTVFFPITA